MKFTLSWLRDHLDTDADAGAVADALTRIGLEVEGVHNPGAALAAFRIARVLAAAPHPQADKLQVLSVDAGDGPTQVVCGAPNARAGLVGVFGPPGAYVPGSGITLKVAAIRGVTSNGMMCSTRELELGEEHDGIIELAADAPVGAAYPAWAGLDDPVFDVSVTPNRQDCMGVRGIARDLAAAGLGVLRDLEAVVAKRLASASVQAELVAEHLSSSVHPELVEGLPSSLKEKDSASTTSAWSGAGDRAGAGLNIRTDDPSGCPAFFAQAVSGVVNGPSPEWMRRRLLAIGQKPIGALVDVTNYLMFDLGRPLHVYDRAVLSGPLVARRARPGESVVALNGRRYALTPGMTVIADDVAVHDIGGIMGGEHSGVAAATTDVLIECAFFDPDSIARTGQALALTSDARSRFERGVDPAFLDEGLAIATRYVVALCGGTASSVTRSGEAPLGTRSYAYDPDLAETLGGLAVAPERQRAILGSLGFAVSDGWQVTPPTWRRDVDGPADLVEEVIRIEGLDKVASVPLSRPEGVARPTATPAQKQERRTRRAAVARGLDEAVTWSFLSAREADAFGGAAWVLANPISEELRAMRPSLLPGLLSAAARNQKRGAGGVRLFEIGRRYLMGQDGLSDERATLGLVLAGDRRSRGWREGKAAAFDAFDAKAEALALLAAAGAPIDNLQVMPVPSGVEGPVPSGVEGGGAGSTWHPGQSGTLRLGPRTVLAAFGMLHPNTLKAFDLDDPVAAAELYLDAIPVPKDKRRGAGPMRAPFAPPALQPVRRDFAFTVPAGLTADTLLRSVRGADKASITAARLFDLFERASEEGAVRSMAVEVTLQPGDKSFTDAELKVIADKVVAAAAKQGAVLRG
ncbi:phenylalanine--tRNA ligase subunit beta [uncultured Sphingomonas sp.]|uniref:phenylalanine--tRNA ligase subunit beta n=1 Tax=uncultured Sphingomonas sp. TaxID=158754 RepID=UPI0035CAF11A